jgi:hydrogenase nickel incorporation protein HypB
LTATVDLRKRVLEENERQAARLRSRFRGTRTLVVNLISSPGSGKTTLLEATVRGLSGRLRMAVIEGDIATERDAERLRALGVPAHQILTGGACHLDARQIGRVIDERMIPEANVLFIENVGNLICPTSYDLGEDFKVALLSVPEGDDKPFKYPATFAQAAITLITKVDLLPHVRFDLEAVRRQVSTLRPDGEFLVTSSATGEGMAAWTGLLETRLAEKVAIPRE